MIQRSLLRSSRALCSTKAPTSFTSPFRHQSHLAGARVTLPSQRIVSRWYSEAGEAQKKDASADVGEEAAKAGQSGAEGTAAPTDAAKKELEAKNKEVVELKDKYLRSVADFRNLQDRTKREVQSAKDFAIQRFSRDLIESIDNLDRALTTVPADKINAETNKELADLHGGLKMTERILMDTLKKHGLERFDPSVEGEKFNPNMHEAVFQTPQHDKEDGTVFFTQQKGFTLNGRVIRAAKVGVVKNS